MRFSDFLVKGGPYIGPRGGKWADPQHKIPWQVEKKRSLLSILRDFKFRPKKDKPSTKSRGMLRGLLTKDFGLLIAKSNSLSTLMKFRAIFAAHVNEDVRTPAEKKDPQARAKRTREGHQDKDKTRPEMTPRQMLALIDRRIAFLESKKNEQEADKAPVAVDMDTGKVSVSDAQERPDSDAIHEREDVPEGFPLDKAAFDVLSKLASTRDQAERRTISLESLGVMDALEEAGLAFFTAAKGWLLTALGRKFVDESVEPEPVTESEDNFETMPESVSDAKSRYDAYEHPPRPSTKEILKQEGLSLAAATALFRYVQSDQDELPDGPYGTKMTLKLVEQGFLERGSVRSAIGNQVGRETFFKITDKGRKVAVDVRRNAIESAFKMAEELELKDKPLRDAYKLVLNIMRRRKGSSVGLRNLASVGERRLGEIADVLSNMLITDDSPRLKQKLEERVQKLLADVQDKMPLASGEKTPRQKANLQRRENHNAKIEEHKDKANKARSSEEKQAHLSAAKAHEIARIGIHERGGIYYEQRAARADKASEDANNFDTMPDAEPEPVTESEDNFDTMPDAEPVNEPEDTNVDIEVPKNEEPDSDPNVKPRVKFEDVGEILEGSRKQIAELAEMTREQAAKALTRKKLTKWQGLVKEAGTQAEQGNSPSAAILKDIIISSIAATPFAIGKNDPVTKLVWEKNTNKELEGTTATSNLGELYVSGINFVMRTLDKCKTGEDVLTFLHEWSRKSQARKSLGKRQFDSIEDAKEVMGQGDTLVRYLSIPDPRDYNPNRRVLVKYGEGNTEKEMQDSLSSFVIEQTEEEYGKEKLEQAKHIYRIEYAAPSTEDQNYYSVLMFALAGIRLENQYNDKKRSPLYSMLMGNISDDGSYPGYFRSKKIRDAFALAERFDGKDWDDEDVAQYFGQTIKERKRKSGFRFTREATGEDPRVGGKQIGQTDPERLRTETNMRGLQFGKYVSQKDRGLHVESAHEALSDLSDVLNVPLEDISLSGRLGLAFGARGRGSAAAHYETDQFNINITKKLGGGSLAHEWGHFLDNVMCHAYGLEKPSTQLGTDTVANGRLLSTYAFRGNIPESVPLKVRESFQKVHDAIHKGEPKKPDIQEYKDALEAERKSKREVLSLRRKDVNEYNRRVPEHNRLAERRHYLGQFFRSDEKYDHVKEPRPFEQERIDNFMASIPSRFRADCEAMNSSYLANPAEMFARSFEAFVEDELKNNGRRNNYLVMSTQDIQTTGKTSSLTPAGEEAQIYPQGEDRQRINEAMRGLIEALKEDGAFKKGMKSLRDKDLAILIPPPPSEMERVSELSKVSDQYRNRKCPEQMQDVLDSDMDSLFNAILMDEGLPSSMYMITGISRSIVPEIKMHKDYFGAMRPDVLAQRHGVPFESDFLESAQTPSYPSGHTTQATYLAKVLGSIYPEIAGKLDRLAEQIADSRIDRGVHLPSDNDAGRALADALFSRNSKKMLTGDVRYNEVFGG